MPSWGYGRTGMRDRLVALELVRHADEHPGLFEGSRKSRNGLLAASGYSRPPLSEHQQEKRMVEWAERRLGEGDHGASPDEVRARATQAAKRSAGAGPGAKNEAIAR